MTVSGQVEDLVNEVRWKLSVNASKVFKVRLHFLLESFVMDSTNCLNPSDWIQELFLNPSDWIQAYLCLVTDICYQDEVLPVIEDYRPQPGQPFEAPMNRFHSEWQNWLSKVQGCLFPRQKKSGYYRNMTFDNDSAAALAVCLANVSLSF